MKLKKTRVAAGVMLASIGIAGPALAAEGSWTSSMSGVLTYFDSRTWTDHNSTTNSTNITLGYCYDDRGPSSPYTTSTQLQLTKEAPWYLPDENRGRKNFACDGRMYTNAWGQQPSGNYHFTVQLINGCDSCGWHLWVPYPDVQVVY